MGLVYLIKHSAPEIEPGRPAREWRLSGEGRRRCGDLAAALTGAGITRIAASAEPKATETAALVAGALGVPFEVAGGLHEQERDAVAVFASAAAFEAAIRPLFEQPDRVVFGSESADAACARFRAAVFACAGPVVEEGAPVAVVSHGTVISLLVARAGGLDPFQLWRSLGLPSFAVVSFPDFGLVRVQESIPGRVMG